MESMRERIARAVAKRCDITPFDRLGAADQRHYLETADAVLDELREPTEGMLKAAREAPMPLPNLDSLSARWDLVNRTHWQAMIDEARKE